MWFEADITVAEHPRWRAVINSANILYAHDDGNGGTLVVFSGGPSANVHMPWDDFRGRVGLIPGWQPGPLPQQ